MTDHPENTAGAEIEGPGVQLRRARERRGLLLRDIAQELHLDEWMLQALEDDDFAALGAPVFTKGHMRKYGDMLGLDSDDLMIAYYRKRGRDDSPPPITRIMAPESPRRPMSWRGFRWLLIVLAALIIAFIAWALLTRSGNPGSALPATVTSSDPPLTLPGSLRGQPSEQSDPPQDPTENVSADIAIELPEQQQPATDGAAEAAGLSMVSSLGDGQTRAEAADINDAPARSPDPVGTAQPDVVTAPEPVQVRLILTGESWVEVTDSDGKRLVYAILSQGRSRTVTGRAPIEVFLGLSSAVQLEVNGQAFAIPRGAIRGNTARFVIDPDSR